MTYDEVRGQRAAEDLLNNIFWERFANQWLEAAWLTIAHGLAEAANRPTGKWQLIWDRSNYALQ